MGIRSGGSTSQLPSVCRRHPFLLSTLPGFASGIPFHLPPGRPRTVGFGPLFVALVLILQTHLSLFHPEDTLSRPFCSPSDSLPCALSSKLLGMTTGCSPTQVLGLLNDRFPFAPKAAAICLTANTLHVHRPRGLSNSSRSSPVLIETPFLGFCGTVVYLPFSFSCSFIPQIGVSPGLVSLSLFRLFALAEKQT